MKLAAVLPFLLSLASLVLGQGAPRATDQSHNIVYSGAAFDGIESFQGIRFGHDTSGVNRFKHPTAFTYQNDSTVDATQPGAACPQNTVQTFLGITQNETVSLSEDCLNLLVVRAGGTKQDAKLPVMVWIYGGGDETGAANVSLWEPTKLVAGAAEKGLPLVYVAMNYRLNVFGFANSPSLRAEKSLNSGILDQRLALEWVQKNIAIFGGDPKKVTVFGQSDGATGAGLHMTSYGGKGTVPFQRAIFQSGGPAGDPGVSGNGTLTSTSTVASLAGCTSKDSNTILSCLRNLPYQKLLDGVIQYENTTAERGTFQDIFFPTVDGDYIPAAPTRLLREGRFHKDISVIAGWTYNDGSIFTDTSLDSATGVDTYLQKAYPNLNATTRQTLTTSLYPLDTFTAAAAISGAPSAYFLQAAQIYRDINFACPAIDVTHRVAQYSPQTPVYLYDFNTTSFGLLEQFANATFLGVIHTSDILFAFNQPALGGILPISDEQKAIGGRVSGSWARYVTRGTPTASAAGDNSLAGWNVAYSKSQAMVKEANVGEVNVRVIGGSSAGQHVLRMNSGGVEEMLLRRCAFVNTMNIQRQVQT